MISYDRSFSSAPRLVIGAVVIGLIAAGVWWSMRAEPSAPVAPQGVASAPADAPDSAHRDQLKRAAAALTEAPEILADGRPADFQEDEWKALKEAIGANPNAASELKRVAEYLRFQRGFELWQSMEEGGNTAERRQLADKLILGLPDRMANSEVTFDEALMVCAALVNSMESDETQRNQKVQQCKTRLEQSAPKMSSNAQEREAACLADWERRKAEITGAYFKQSPDMRAANQKQFEADLEAARVDVYGSAQCADLK